MDHLFTQRLQQADDLGRVRHRVLLGAADGDNGGVLIVDGQVEQNHGRSDFFGDLACCFTIC
ncbi:hypothetical protein D3C80_1933990 [compost metagenome]